MDRVLFFGTAAASTPVQGTYRHPGDKRMGNMSTLDPLLMGEGPSCGRAPCLRTAERSEAG